MKAISVKNLEKNYNKIPALKGISFEVNEGEFFGLLGPNGAGKTTALGILTGLVNKTEGEAKLFGKDVVKDYQEARALIGLVPQEFNFDKFEKVQNILYFNAGYFGIPGKDRNKRIKEVLTQLGLWEKREVKAMQLSGGMKRKLMIARALMHKPKILILDEPTAGVDVETRKSMWKYIKQLNKQGITILLTTHYLEEAEELCERIAIINKGEIIKLDDKKNLLSLLEKERVEITFSKSIDKELLKKYSPIISDKKAILYLNPSDWKDLLYVVQSLPVEKIETQQNKLEDIFIQLIGEKQ